MKHHLTQSIASLPELEKQIIVLRFHENLTFREISMVLDLPIRETVKLFTLAIAKLITTFRIHKQNI